MDIVTRIEELYQRHIWGQITEEELAELFALAEDAANEGVFMAMFEGSWNELEQASYELRAAEASIQAEEGVTGVGKGMNMEEAGTWAGGRNAVIRLISVRRWAVAAVVLALLGTGLWWWWRPSSSVQVAMGDRMRGDVPAPIVNRATLTLANGSRVDLDSVGEGAVAKQGSSQVLKSGGGQLVYEAGGKEGAVLYNTLSNPRGSRVVSLVLADGTKVWLNVASSIRYPVAFIGGDRVVEMSGEAYFEVAEDPARPFHVRKGNTDIRVLGTHFNVNAYTDEQDIRVTLLEGRVSVQQERASLVLGPGQQAITGEGAGMHIEKGVDLDAVMAWKNGLFSFAHADLPSVMRELSRWYNVEVNYEGDVTVRSFSGRIDRTLTLDEVLRILTNSRVHYRIESGAPNKLTIRP